MKDFKDAFHNFVQNYSVAEAIELLSVKQKKPVTSDLKFKVITQLNNILTSFQSTNQLTRENDVAKVVINGIFEALANELKLENKEIKDFIQNKENSKNLKNFCTTFHYDYSDKIPFNKTTLNMVLGNKFDEKVTSIKALEKNDAPKTPTIERGSAAAPPPPKQLVDRGKKQGNINPDTPQNSIFNSFLFNALCSVAVACIAGVAALYFINPEVITNVMREVPKVAAAVNVYFN